MGTICVIRKSVKCASHRMAWHRHIYTQSNKKECPHTVFFFQAAVVKKIMWREKKNLVKQTYSVDRKNVKTMIVYVL